MEFTATLLLAFIALAIGVLLGLLFSGLRGSKKKSAEPGDTNLDVVAGLWRDRETGQLAAAVGEKIFRSPDEMNQGERELLVAAAAELRKWSEIPRPAEAGERISTPDAPAGREGRLYRAGEGWRADRQPAPANSLNPFKIFGAALNPGNPQGTAPGSQSIVLQIDEILQEKLKNSSLEGHGIRLVELPGRGMAVVVGLQRYDSIEEVPDPEIREAIRQATSEWESRMMGK